MLRDGIYSVTLENTDIVVRIPKDLIDQAALSKLLDYLELETLRQRSQLTAAEAEALAAEVDEAVWDTIKPPRSDIQG